MTQFSWNYSCDPDTGDAGPLTPENLAAARIFMGSLNPQAAGVVFWTDDTPANVLLPGTPPGLSAKTLTGLLIASDNGSGGVDVDTGVAQVLGRLFVNDDTATVDINGVPGEANATDLIVLRRNNLSAVEQSVRLARKRASSPGNTAVLQQDGTIWEVALAEVLLDASGELDTVTNVAQLTTPPGTLVKIAEEQGTGGSDKITFDNIPRFFRALQVVGTAVTNQDALVILRLNNTAGTSYDFGIINGENSAITYQGSVSQPGFNVARGNAAPEADTFVTTINHYTNPDLYTAVSSRTGSRGYGGSGLGGLTIKILEGWFLSTDIVTRLDFICGSGNFSTDTVITLYGIV